MKAFADSRPARIALTLGALLLIIFAGRAPAGAQEPAPAAAEGTTIYLPLLRGGGQQQPPPTTVPTDPPLTPVPVAGGAQFFTTDVKTNDADIAVDPSGGMHVAFKTFVAEVEHPAAYYGYCPGNPATACGDGAGWKFISFGERVDEVQLELTADGRPRLLIRWRQESSLNYEYVYAECDGNCTGENSWSGMVVLKASISGVFDKDNPQRSFALDPQGRPRFVYTNAWGAGKPEGVFYVSCDSACADASQAQWVETRITPDEQYKSETLAYPSLAFTRDGRPRVVGVMGLSGTEFGLHYLACDAGCDDLSGWSSTFLGERGGGAYASWDLELDAQERPRVAQYQAGLSAGDPGKLVYRSCDGACDDPASWRSLTISDPGVGVNADLELDAQGRPRIAYGMVPTAGNLLGYAWCDGDCEGDAARWQRKIVETGATLDATFKPAIPFNCQEQAWAEAVPALSLDAAGNPRIAYDALNAAMCYYDLGPGNGTGYRAEKIWRAARLTFFAQP